jgi:23S rRNA-/tRNA-specific pseudouridylate synthase
MEDLKKEEEKEQNDLINKKRKRETKAKDKNKNNNNKPKKEQRKTKQKILNEYYNLKPVIKIENNVRLIEPYEFKYQLYIKRRWLGKKLIEVLQSEFHLYSKDYFINAIKEGKILINEKQTSEDYILKDNDFLTHLTLRKENPIIFQKLEIIYEDNDYLVVDKPSSWPVHICGAYNFNTLQRILMDEYNYKDIKILHRLDKQTSGIVIFAKNANSAELFRNKLHTDDVQKIYFARIKGDFSNILNKKELINENGRIVCKKYLKPLDKAKGIHTDVDDKEVEEFLNNKNKKEEKSNNVGDKDKEIFEPKYAETEFEFLFYDIKSNTSVVKCYPKTGRTHQIRIHLKCLGFPIANDPCYGGIIFNDLKEFENPELKEYQYSNTDNNDIFSVSELYCYKIWLHALSYKFDKYEFKTKEPEWANKNYKIEHKF